MIGEQSGALIMAPEPSPRLKFPANASSQIIYFDLKMGEFLTNSKVVSRQSVLASESLSHPLFTERILSQRKKNHYVYMYQDYSEFLLALRYVYATLLQVENPSKCVVHIQPGAQYHTNLDHEAMYFSIHAKKPARQQLSVAQLSGIISKISGYPFQYGNDIILDRQITYLDLPDELDADNLYYMEDTTQSMIDQRPILDKYELRYFNRKMGCGLFARTDIKQGELIARYSGQFMPKNLTYKSYCFIPADKAGYNLMLDGAHYGNVSRFINHAPSPENSSAHIYLSANVVVENYLGYGNSHFFYVADRDIACGEQLLVSYGNQYFLVPDTILHLKKNGEIHDNQNRKINDTPQQRKEVLSVFASFGSRQAQWLLIRKPFIVLLLCIMWGLLS